MKVNKLLPLLIILITADYLPGFGQTASTITYVSLVNRLTDLKSIAKLPVDGEKSAMWSSYDRRSKYSAEIGYINWSANDDGFSPQYIRKEGENEVLAEMTGPGAIVRIWSANPARGKVKIYIDGQRVPVIDQSFRDYFSASIPAFDHPALVYETNARGFNNYVPIPYQKSCKIVAEPGWGQYYHFNYITFPKASKVESFQREMSQGNLQALRQVNQVLTEGLGGYPYEKGSSKTEAVDLTIMPNQKVTFIKQRGPGAITKLMVKMHIPNSIKMDEVLRKITLEIKWDDESSPSVWAPIGDFFGSAPGINYYKTLPMAMTEEGLISYWYMPYEKSAEIKVHNEYDQSVRLTMEVTHEPIAVDMTHYGRFHAKWHRDMMPLQDKNRWPDWTALETKGRGRFVGMSLSVWNPKGGSCVQHGGEGHYWWGEGDEKFFVDGEKFPSTFGTGTEDYFGYAWCNPNRFVHAFHSQTIDSDNMGYQSVNRWQIIDNVPFQKSFDAYLEKYFPNHWPTQYAMMVYWYLNPEGDDPIGPTAVGDRFAYEIPFKVFKVSGVAEGERMEIKENTGGWASTETWVHEDLFDSVSNHKALIWFAEPGKQNELTTEFFWPETGDYNASLHIVRSVNGGEFQFELNEQPLGKSVSFASASGRANTELISLNNVKLTAGKQRLVIRWSGNDKEKNHLQLDYIGFRPGND